MAERNIHKEFQKSMQEAWEEYVIDPSELTDEKIPEPDLSFLDKLLGKIQLSKIQFFLFQPQRKIVGKPDALQQWLQQFLPSLLSAAP